MPSSYTLQLRDASRSETVSGVAAFVGQDASGSFAVWPGHARFMTALVFGLARFRCGSAAWQYLAVPGALLYFLDGTLHISSRRYLLDGDYQRISRRLQEELLREEEALGALKQNLRRMEGEFLKRLWRMGQQGGGV